MKISNDRKRLYMRCPDCNFLHEVVYDEDKALVRVIHAGLPDQVVSTEPDELGDVMGVMHQNAGQFVAFYPVAVQRPVEWFTDGDEALLHLQMVIEGSLDMVRPHMRTLAETGMLNVVPEEIREQLLQPIYRPPGVAH